MPITRSTSARAIICLKEIVSNTRLDPTYCFNFIPIFFSFLQIVPDIGSANWFVFSLNVLFVLSSDLFVLLYRVNG